MLSSHFLGDDKKLALTFIIITYKLFKIHHPFYANVNQELLRFNLIYLSEMLT